MAVEQLGLERPVGIGVELHERLEGRAQRQRQQEERDDRCGQKPVPARRRLRALAAAAREHAERQHRGGDRRDDERRRRQAGVDQRGQQHDRERTAGEQRRTDRARPGRSRSHVPVTSSTPLPSRASRTFAPRRPARLLMASARASRGPCATRAAPRDPRGLRARVDHEQPASRPARDLDARGERELRPRPARLARRRRVLLAPAPRRQHRIRGARGNRRAREAQEREIGRRRARRARSSRRAHAPSGGAPSAGRGCRSRASPAARARRAGAARARQRGCAPLDRLQARMGRSCGRGRRSDKLPSRMRVDMVGSVAYTLIHGDDPGIESFRGVFMKIRRALGATAFGINEVRLPRTPPGWSTTRPKRATRRSTSCSTAAGRDGRRRARRRGGRRLLRVDAAATRQLLAGPEGMRFLAVGAQQAPAYDGRESL